MAARAGVAQASTYGKPSDGPDEKRLEYEKSKMGTSCILNVYSLAGALVVDAMRFDSTVHGHAEENAIAYLQGLVADGTLTYAACPYTAVFAISKSPCSSTSVPATRTDGNPGCLERLEDLRVNGIADPAGRVVAFHVQLIATKAYQPPISGAKQASKDSYDGFGDGGASGAFPMVR